MFATMKQIFKPENKDLRRRIYFTLFCLFIFKLGTTIIVPGVDAKLLRSNLGFLELINAMGGGALEKFSIFALGVMPYITASIIIQLLQMDIVPYLTELSKQGQTGRNKLNQITRVAGIALAFIQGYLFSFAFIQNGTSLQYMEFALILTAGTAFLLWIGDQITKKGLGNGTSMIIMAGILASITTNTEDFQQLQMPIVILSLVGYYLAMMAGVFEGSLFIKIFAFVPFISAILAPSLLILGQIGIFEFVIAIVLMILTNYILIKYGLRIYKVGILNYSSKGLWKKMFKALRR